MVGLLLGRQHYLLIKSNLVRNVPRLSDCMFGVCGKEESEQAAPQPKPAQPERRRSVQISDMKDSTDAVKSCFLNQCNWGYNTQNWTFSRNIWGWGKMGPTFKAGPKDVLSLF